MAKTKFRIEGEDATAAAFKSALGRAQGTANKMSGAFKAAFAGISVASVIGAGRAAIAMGDELNNAAKNAGIAGSAMSELAYVAKQSDIEIAALSKSIKTMKVNLSEAASGAKGPIESLRAIGLEIKDLRGLKADEQFMLIGDAISRMGDATDKSRALTEIFGKAGEDVGRAFENGAEGVRKLREEAIATGAALSDETIQKLANADDAVKRLQSSWEGFAASMTSKVAPALITAMNYWSDAPRTFSEQIADLEDQLDDVVTTRASGAETQRAAIRKRIAELRELAKQESMREMGISAGGGGAAKPAPPGYGKAAAIDKKIEEQEKLALAIRENDRENSRELQGLIDKDHEKQLEAMEEEDETKREMAQRWKDYEAEQAEALSENAQIFKDAFLNAWDDMVNTGKFSIDELFKYIIAQFARRGIAKLFDSIFAGGGSGGGGGGLGGLFGGGSSIVQGEWDWMKKIGGIFGFAKGGRPRPGVPYLVGEEGPEVRIDDGAGTILPNGMGGGGGSVNVVNNYDLRGSDPGVMKMLPRILEQHKKATIAEIMQGLRRQKYA